MGASYSFSIEVEEDAAELASALLHDAGCLGLEVRDAELKPMPNQRVPQPGQVLLVAYFGGQDEVDEARALLASEFPGAPVEVAVVPDEDWSEAWKAQVKSVTAGRLWVGPPWEAPKAPAGLVKITIEPGMAFGTGDHPTTRFCLESVDGAMAARKGASVLDVGTGSGVLAIAARKLGAGRVVGTDNDPVAIRVAQENAGLNHAAEIDFSTSPLEQVQGTFDVVLANILANTLVELAPAISAHLAPGGQLYLAGILAPQADEVLRAYTAQGLTPQAHRLDGEWALVSVTRPGPAS